MIFIFLSRKKTMNKKFIKKTEKILDNLFVSESNFISTKGKRILTDNKGRNRYFEILESKSSKSEKKSEKIELSNGEKINLKI